MIWYCPDESVTVDRDFSISAGLDASTRTPGSTAPELSFTTPVMDACAYAATGSSVSHRQIAILLGSACLIGASCRLVDDRLAFAKREIGGRMLRRPMVPCNHYARS